MTFKDTYFIDSEAALAVAKEKNRVECTIAVDGLQICYYAGEKLRKSPKNCIHLPFENVYKYFTSSMNRVPQKISYENTDYSPDQQKVLTKKVTEIIEAAQTQRVQLMNKYVKKIKLYKPNFSQPLRVFLSGCRETTVMQYASENIANTFKRMGYQVKFYIQKNDMEFCCALGLLKALYKYKPHITININHLNNEYLHEKMLNFIWFQDPMPILTDNSKLNIRQRDFFFSLLDTTDISLIKKGVSKKKILRQHIATNESIYNTKYKISRENKIVFIGAAYVLHFNNLPNEELVIEEIRKSIVSNKLDLAEMSRQYSFDYDYLKDRLYPGVIRREMVKMICEHSKIPVEVYGLGWDKVPEVKPFFKGILNYGVEVAKVYNSAKYGLVPNGYYQQRIYEMALSGTIPLVYDTPIEKKPFKYADSCLLFKDTTSFKKTIKSTPTKNLKQISKDGTYKNMVKNILKLSKKVLSKKNTKG